MHSGSNSEIDIVNSADSGFATTMIPKYVFVKMLTYTTNGKYAASPNWNIQLNFRCATGSTTVNVPTVLQSNV